MRILLIANFEPDRQESMQRFCELLRSGLASDGQQVRILRPEPFFARFQGASAGLQKWLGYMDKFLLFPWVLINQARAYDVVHICDHSNSMYTNWLRGRPNVVTCHDLMAVRSALGEIPRNPTGWSGRLLQGAILRGLRRAQMVVCVSEQTRRDVNRLAGRDDAHTWCVPNGLNYAYSAMDRAEAWKAIRAFVGDHGGPFFLHVGANHWYKNRPGLLEIFSSLRSRPQFSNCRLVVVGEPFDAGMRHIIKSGGLSDAIIELASLSNEELRALYSVAEGFLFPSLDEGFGWPIVEAQACGCPVFTSNRKPMTEVGGEAAVYFDPLNPIDACAAIAGGLERRPQLIAAGLANAKRFSAAHMLRAYVRVYEIAARG